MLLLIPVLLLVGVIVFTLMHLTPGDPASIMLGREATEEQKEALRERLGLNEPVPVQFVNWFGKALRLDFGESLGLSLSFLLRPTTENSVSASTFSTMAFPRPVESPVTIIQLTFSPSCQFLSFVSLRLA